MPNEGTEIKDIEFMPSIRGVMKYSGMGYNDVLELPVDVFLLMRKNYILDKLKETEEGREYLKKCERLKITEPDLKGIRELKARLAGEKNA